MMLKDPVPQPRKYEEMNWWRGQCSRSEFEDLLKEDYHDGVFLVRRSKTQADSLAISFRVENKIEHRIIKEEGRLFKFGVFRFESLDELVSYYVHHPIYKNIKLTHAVGHCPIKPNQNSEGASISACGTVGCLDPNNYATQPSELTPIGNPHKRYLDMMGAVVHLAESERTGLENILRIQNTNTPYSVFEMAAPSLKSAAEWKKSIEEAALNAAKKQKQLEAMEQEWKIAKEMSDLIVYCCTVPFNVDRLREKGFVFYEMSSFQETRAEKLICQLENQFFIKYHQFQLSRVYPVGYRFDSSNYNPIPLWNSGSQMVALNYQTGDKPMQLNYAKFREQGNCGYLLKPDFMLRDDFNPYDKNDLDGVDTIKINLRIIGARHLNKKPGRRNVSPFVEVEVLGADFDEGVKLTTRSITDNGFNPIWDEFCEFEIANPHFDVLRFLVQDEDMFENSIFLGQATFPVRCLRTGYRSVPLKNSFSEDLELSSLLVHISITISPVSTAKCKPIDIERPEIDNQFATFPHGSSQSSGIVGAASPLPPPSDVRKPERLVDREGRNSEVSSCPERPWLHNVTSEEAIALIQGASSNPSTNPPPDGYFLLRPSRANMNQPWTLVVWYRNKTYNIAVRERPDGRYALGNVKPREQSFASIEAMVNFYQHVEEVVLNSETGDAQVGSTRLTETPPKRTD